MPEVGTWEWSRAAKLC